MSFSPVVSTASLSNRTGNWEATFYLAGTAILLTGILGLVNWIVSLKAERNLETDIGPTGDDMEHTNAEGTSRESLINPSKRRDIYGSIQEY